MNTQKGKLSKTCQTEFISINTVPASFKIRKIIVK